MMNEPTTGAVASTELLGPLLDREEDPARLWAEIHRLRAAVAGPNGYASWQDAATAERLRRGQAERELRNIAEAKRFDRERFDDDTSFSDWAQSRARHVLTSARQTDEMLVPVEPTQDMLYAMAECDGFHRGDRDHPGLTRWADYWRMALSVLRPNTERSGAERPTGAPS